MVDSKPGGDANTDTTNSDNSGWFSSIINSIKEGFQSLKDGFKGIIDIVIGPLKSIVSFFGTLLEYLNPLSDKFFLKVALIPRNGYFMNYFDDIKKLFDAKLPIVPQLFSFFGILFNSTFGDAPIPSFTFTWGGVTMSIVDFSFFTQYRTLVINFIRFSSWFFFLKRLYNRLPSMIY